MKSKKRIEKKNEEVKWIKNSLSSGSLASLVTGDSLECGSRKYQKISATTRNQLLNQIFFKGKKIKKAAKDLGINYSSAKTILHLYRKKFKQHNLTTNQPQHNQCHYSSITNNQPSNPIQVYCSFGGHFNNHTQQPLSNQFIQFIQSLITFNNHNNYYNNYNNEVQTKKVTNPIIVTPIDKNIFN